MNTPTLHEYLTKKLEQKRKEHPSFRLMEIDDRLFPNAQTKHSTLVLEARNSNDESKTVAEIVAESWKKGDKNHLMIEGEGGIGKTVTLLSIPDKFTPFPVPAIYIPLHELPQGDDPIERYIKKKVLNNKEDLFGQLLDLLDNPWDKGPQLLLLLDGFNEIAAENRQTISEDIKYWSEFQGIQIVTSSRYDIHTYVALSYDYSAIKLQPLSNTTAEAYLNSMGARIPTDSAVKELITIPLLLTLYVKTELILEQRETDSAEFKEVKNAGTIVWNYLQCELWRFGREAENAKTAIIAMEFIAPYLAWQMQKNSLFVLSKKEFHDFMDDAYRLLETHFNEPTDFSFHIQDALQIANGIPSLELIRNLLENHLCLFVKNGNSYKLMHQQFRDALAAMHLINSIYLNGNSLPTEWTSTIDYYVMQFVANLISENEAYRLWEQNRTSPQLESSTRNQLELQSRLHNCDYSKLNFSGLDLSNISLFLYRIGNTKIKLPIQADGMDLTVLSEKTFSTEAHNGPVNSVVLAQSGKYIVSGSSDKTIRIWDLESGDCIRKFVGHNATVKSIVVVPKRKRVVSGALDGSICIWDIESGKCLQTLKEHQASINTVAVTPDNKHIVSGSWDNDIRVWNMESGECTKILKGHQSGVDAIAIAQISNTTRIVSISYDNTIRLWDPEHEKCLKTIDRYEVSMNTIAFTPDCKNIICGSWDNIIRIWDLESGICVKELVGHDALVHTITVTPDSRYIVSGSVDKTIRIWDFNSGKSIKILKGHKSRINAVIVTPDSRRIVSGSEDNSIRIWDLESGVCIKTLEGYDWSVNAVAITPNGKTAVCGFTDKTIRFWNMERRQCQKTMEGHFDLVTALAITPDGRRVVSGSRDKTIRVWDMENEQCLRKLEGLKNWVTAIAITPDGRRIFSGSDDKAIRVWNLEGWQVLKQLEGHYDSVTALAITPDGRHLVSGSRDKTIRLWDIESGACLKTLEGHKNWVTAVAVSLDGKYVISGSNDHTLRVWVIESGKCMKTLERHESWVHAIALTADGKYVISCSDDSTIRIRDLKSGKNLTTIRIHPLSFVGLDFSKAIFSTPELKETLRQNGAKVDPD